MRPVSAEFETSQTFGAFPTAGVSGNWNGSTVQRLVAQYGNYQPYGHAGEDIACPIGTPVRAIADGIVVWADWGTNLPGDDTDAGYRRRWYLYKSFPGIVTVIQHEGWLSVYGHLSSNDAAPRGTRVKEGQLIGYSGDTGGVAPHLHVAAIVDLSYRTGGGLIYGCADPAPFYGTNSGVITTQSTTTSTTTTVGDDDMTVEDTQYMKEKLARLEELSLSFEKVLTDPVTGVIRQAAEITLKGGVGSRYVRSEVTGEDTVYERTDDGKLRPIGLAEFQLAMKAGETYRLVPKWMIDALPKAA